MTFKHSTTAWDIPAGSELLPHDAPRADWLAARQRGVTATDMRVLAGHGYADESVFQRWQEKVGSAPPEPDVTPLAWELGRDEEPILRKHAERHFGVETRHVGIIESLWSPRWLASPDLLSDDGGLVETKHTSSGSLSRHFDPDSPWTNDDGFTLPPAWLTQVRWQRHVTGRAHAHVFALLSDRRRFTAWTVPEDAEAELLLVDLADTFWRHVQTGEPPPIEWDTVTAAEVKARYPSVARPSVVLGDDDAETVRALLAERRELGAMIGELSKAKSAIELKLQAAAGDAEDVLDGEGRVLFSYPVRRRKGYVVEPSTYRQLVLPKLSTVSPTP